MTPQRVVVVGGGLAGLAAASGLERSGARVTLLEAREAFGGRARRRSLGPHALDGLPQTLPERAPALAGLLCAAPEARIARHRLTRVGVATASGGVSLRKPSLSRALARSPLRVPRLARMRSILSWLGARVDPTRPEGDTRLDDRSLHDLAQVYLGRRAFAELLAPLAEVHFGLDPANASRQVALDWLDRLAEPRLCVASGLATLCEALAKQLDDARSGARAAAVLSGGAGVALAEGGEIEADAVVLAVEPAEALRLSSDWAAPERDVLAQIRMLPALHVVVSGGREARAPQALWIPRPRSDDLAGWVDAAPDSGGVKATRVLCARSDAALQALDDADAAEAAIKRAERFWPELRETAHAPRLVRDRVPAFNVGHYRSLARLGELERRVGDRRVYLCGDWRVAPHAEGAVASGLRAAERVLTSA